MRPHKNSQFKYKSIYKTTQQSLMANIFISTTKKKKKFTENSYRKFTKCFTMEPPAAQPYTHNNTV